MVHAKYLTGDIPAVMYRPTGFVTDEVIYGRTEENLLPLTKVEIPLGPEKRKATDKVFTGILLISITIAILLLLFTCIITELYTDRPQLVLSHQNEFENYDIKEIGWKLALIAFFSVGLSLIMATLYRYATSFVVWGILILWWLSVAIPAVVVWFVVESIVPKIIMPILTVILLCALIYMRDRVQLATMLFRQSAKAVFDMKALLSVPVVIALLVLIVAVIYFPATFYIVYSGTSASYFRIASAIFNTIITVWILQFLAGIKYLIVSGAVSKWYFTKNKRVLGDPVYTSCYVTLKYHTGTAALGSLIITAIGVLRSILKNSSENSRFGDIVNGCCACIEEFVKICTNSVYIITAMHGTPFFKSGKQAVKLLTLNLCNTISITGFGEFVLVTSSILIVGLSMVISYFVLNIEDKYCLILFSVISILCCSPVLDIFEISFSTLFLCTCQDFLINNGNDKPYAMTRDMMEYLEGSKKMFAKTIEKKNLPKI